MLYMYMYTHTMYENRRLYLILKPQIGCKSNLHVTRSHVDRLYMYMYSLLIIIYLKLKNNN